MKRFVFSFLVLLVLPASAVDNTPASPEVDGLVKQLTSQDEAELEKTLAGIQALEGKEFTLAVEKLAHASHLGILLNSQCETGYVSASCMNGFGYYSPYGSYYGGLNYGANGDGVLQREVSQKNAKRVLLALGDRATAPLIALYRQDPAFQGLGNVILSVLAQISDRTDSPEQYARTQAFIATARLRMAKDRLELMAPGTSLETYTAEFQDLLK